MKWTKDEAHNAVYVVLVGMLFAASHETSLIGWFYGSLLSIVGAFVLYAVVGVAVDTFCSLRKRGVELNPLAHLGLRGTKPYNAAYTALFKTVRHLEEQDDLRYFTYREVFSMSFYGPDDKRKGYEIRARNRAWNDIKPLLLEYSNGDARLPCYIGFIKR